MKIIYSVGANVPGGGIGNLAGSALEAIVKQDYLQKAILADFRGDFIPSDQLVTFPWINRIPNYFLKDNLFDLLASRRIEATDIFHGWNNFALLSMRRAKKKGARTVIERASSHIITQNSILEAEFKKAGLQVRPIHPWVIKKAVREYQEADFVLVPSDFAHQSFLDQGFDKKKLILLKFGVDTKKFLPRQRRPDGVFRAIFAGQVGIRKGIGYLLQAWQELDLKDSELLLIGPVATEFKDLMQNYTLSKVRPIAYTTRLQDYYQISDCFIFPTVEEGSALVTFEALASGLPLITTPNAGSVVEDGKEGLLVDVGNVESLKEAILKLYNNRALLDKFSALARRKAEDYPWSRYQTSLIAAYREIIF